MSVTVPCVRIWLSRSGGWIGRGVDGPAATATATDAEVDPAAAAARAASDAKLQALRASLAKAAEPAVWEDSMAAEWPERGERPPNYRTLKHIQHVRKLWHIF